MAQPALKRRQTWGVLNRYFLTNVNARLALPFTGAFVWMGLHPNTITLLSFAISVLGMVLVADPLDVGLPWLGAVLLMVGLWWDHSDGQVARATGRSSPSGALLDTILDRWVEAGWVAALAVGALLHGQPRSIIDWPGWALLLVACAAVHATLYVRWANVQRDLYIVQKELRQAQRQSPPDRLEMDAPPVPQRRPEVRTFYLPFAFNRDVTMWLLFAITLAGDWVLGLLLFAAVHAANGLEKNWYARQDLRNPETKAVRSLLDPDYHK